MSRVHCAGCGAAIDLAAGERVGLRDACPRCRVDLHACRNCRHHDPGARNQCREPASDPVADRERANRCDWFAAAEGGAPRSAAPARDAARSALDALFRKK